MITEVAVMGIRWWCGGKWYKWYLRLVLGVYRSCCSVIVALGSLVLQELEVEDEDEEGIRSAGFHRHA